MCFNCCVCVCLWTLFLEFTNCFWDLSVFVKCVSLVLTLCGNTMACAGFVRKTTGLCGNCAETNMSCAEIVRTTILACAEGAFGIVAESLRRNFNCFCCFLVVFSCPATFYLFVVRFLFAFSFPIRFSLFACVFCLFSSPILFELFVLCFLFCFMLNHFWIALLFCCLSTFVRDRTCCSFCLCFIRLCCVRSSFHLLCCFSLVPVTFDVFFDI